MPVDPPAVPEGRDVPEATGSVVVLGLVTAAGGVYVVAKTPFDASNRSSDAFAGADTPYPIKVQCGPKNEHAMR